MSFFKKLGRGLGKIGKGLVKTVAKVGSVAVGIAAPIAATAVGAVLPGGLGKIAANAVSGVGMGLQQVLSPKEKKEVEILHDSETVRAAAHAPEAMAASLPAGVAGSPFFPHPHPYAISPTASAVAQGVASATQVQVNNNSAMELIKKYFWVPIVGILAFMLLKKK